MIKVVQILGSLDRGGIETWLKDVVLNYDKNNFQIDFILLKEKEGAYDNIVAKEGSTLHKIPLNLGILKFSYLLYKKLKSEKYDVVHAHPHYFCGYVCLIAKLAGVPLRIAHSHSDKSIIEKKLTARRNLYIKLQVLLINLFCNKKIACSQSAGVSLFGNKQFTTLYCGVDFSKFTQQNSNPQYKEQLFKEFNIPANAICIGHVGSFREPKNHTFLIDILHEINKISSDYYLIMAGEGPLKERIENKCKTLNIENVIFLGERSDVNLLMKDVFDIFVFPSLYEGLGIVLLEAQASGLKSIASDTVPKEVSIIKDQIIFLSIKESPDIWAKKVLELEKRRGENSNIEEILTQSPFNINNSIRHLENVYSKQ